MNVFFQIIAHELCLRHHKLFWSTSTDIYFSVHYNKSILKVLEIDLREHVITLSMIIRVEYIVHILIVGVSLCTTHAILVRLKMIASSEKENTEWYTT